MQPSKLLDRKSLITAYPHLSKDQLGATLLNNINHSKLQNQNFHVTKTDGVFSIYQDLLWKPYFFAQSNSASFCCANNSCSRSVCSANNSSSLALRASSFFCGYIPEKHWSYRLSAFPVNDLKTCLEITLCHSSS